MQFLEKNQYHTDDPYVKEIINEQIRKQLAINLGQNDPQDVKTKKGKSAQQQTLMNLKSDGEKFKYLWSEEGIEEIDYEQQEEDLRRNREMELTEPIKYKVIGYIQQKSEQKRGRLRKRPILRMTDLYLTSNQKMKRLINHVFDRHIYGKLENKKPSNQNIITSNCASNSNELQQILKKYQNNEEDYNFQNLQLKLDQQQLQEYIIDHNQSKSNYFLFYKHEHPSQPTYQVLNHPLASRNFLDRLHAEVRQLQARKNVCTQMQQEGRDLKKDWEQKKLKEYYGQFKKNTKIKLSQKCKIKDNFHDNFSSKHQIAKNIFEFYSYVDNQLLQETYKKSLQENDRLELNLNSPYFFQTKLHTIMNKQREIIRDDNQSVDYKTNFNIEQSHMSMQDKGYKHKSGFQNDRKDGIADQEYEEDNTIEKVIEGQIRNVYKQPLKHSEVATKFQYVKFTLEEDCFNLYHKFFFNFQEQLHSGRIRIEIVQTKRRKDKPNRLIINSQMKQSNEKFSHKQDLSLANKDQFIIVQYIQQTPLLMSDVGMCERMIIQVNHEKMLQTINKETIDNKSLEEMEEELQEKKPSKLTFDTQCQLWRKKIKDLFGPNGKQYFWDPKKDGKLIGIPQGPGVTIMESNLCNIPIVKKQSNRCDFLLVRDGKKWVLRKIDWLYVSGQTEPNIKVFCPGSRQHTQFKLSYQKAFVIKQIKEYGSVNFDLLKLTFKGQTENSLRKALKNANAISKDSKNYKLSSQSVKNTLIDLSPQDVCIYQRMQKSLCQLKEVGISQIKSNEKMKNVLKEFNRKHFMNHQKIAIARMIRQQLQLTSWYLTDSFLKYKQKASKIQINGFADPTNGKGGYSYINKPQKQRTSKQDMEQKVEKNKNSQVRDLRKLKVDASKELLRQMGHNQDEIQQKGRWALINVLKNKEGTQYSRRERETKYKKIQNQKKDISKNFNKLLNYLYDKTEEPAFDYKREKRNKLVDFMKRERQYWEKIKRKFSKPIGEERDDNRSQESDQED